MASIKLLPLFGLLGFLIPPQRSLGKIKVMVSGIGAFLLVHLANAAIFPRWMPSYLGQIMGRLPGHGAYHGGGQYNQNTIDFVTGGLDKLGFVYPLPEFALGCIGLGLGYSLALACSGRTGSRLSSAASVSMAVLVLLLLLFRQKNYAFVTLIPFLLTAGFEIGPWTAYGALLASVLLPAMLVSHTIPSPYLLDYDQLLGAWAAVLVLLAGSSLERGGEAKPLPLES